MGGWTFLGSLFGLAILAWIMNGATASNFLVGLCLIDEFLLVLGLLCLCLYLVIQLFTKMRKI
jgi:hypothetical protein